MLLEELMERLKEYDVDDLIVLFKIDSENLVETMEWYIADNYDELVKEVGEIETPWDYY